jgi:hypothetical protein
MDFRFSVTRTRPNKKTSHIFFTLGLGNFAYFLNYLEGLGPIWAQGIDEKVRKLLRRWPAFRQLSTKHKYNLQAIGPFTLYSSS